MAALARILEHGVADNDGGTLVGISAASETQSGDIHLRPLQDHPAVALRGFRAPDEWQALGFAGAGRTHTLATDEPGPLDATIDEAGQIPDLTSMAAVGGVEPSAVTVVYLCARHGGGWTRLSTSETTLLDRALDRDPADHQGLVADAVRCALGLETAPFAMAGGAVWFAMWLEHVLSLALALPAPSMLRWDDICKLVPDWAANDNGTALQSCLPHRLAEEVAGGAGDQEQLDRVQLAAAAGQLQWIGIEPESATWFDRSAMARAVLATLPPPEIVLDELEQLIEPTLIAHLRTVAASCTPLHADAVRGEAGSDVTDRR